MAIYNSPSDKYVATRFGTGRPGIDQAEKQRVTKYLENPVASGLWQVTATWMQDSGISTDLLALLAQETKDRDTISIHSGKRVRTIKITREWLEDIKLEICSTLTFIFAFFDQLASQDEQRPEDRTKYGVTHETVQLLLDLVDITPIRTKYSKSLDLFRQTIWCAAFVPAVTEGNPATIGTGTFTVQLGPRKNNKLSAISWTDAPLRSLLHFLQSIGKVDQFNLVPIFSPEEEVFAPYFDLLKLAQDYAVPQQHLQPFIAKAIANFDENNYTDCVSTLGLASEDVLTQIYETYYREQLTRSLTLGQLADEILTRAASRFRKKEEAPPDFSSLYPELKAAIEEPAATGVRALELTRKLLSLVQEMHKSLNIKIDKIGKPEQRFTVWPERVNYAINELIRYRNASSHKSRIPIGPVECRRSAYSFVVLLRWWLHERTLFDWSKSPEEILRASVERYSKA